MQVLGGHSFDHAHLLSTSGAYEWWYVDAQSADGEWGIVVIVFRGMPMSPDYLAALSTSSEVDPTDHCGYAVSVYHRGARIATAFHGVPAQECAFSVTDCDVQAATVSIRRTSDGAYSVHAITRVREVPHDVEITATLVPTSHPAGIASDPEPHAWIVAAPRCTAHVDVMLRESGAVRTHVQWSGMGYHDHNVGVRPMQADHGDWYWGRVHDADRTIVYLATPGAQQPSMWLGVADANGLHWCDNVSFERHQRRISFMGLRYHRSIHCRGTLPSGGSLDVVCVNTNVVENGPFYQRYASDWTVNGTPSKQQGMSEYMDCARYRRAWIRPFLRTIWQQR